MINNETDEKRKEEKKQGVEKEEKEKRKKTVQYTLKQNNDRHMERPKERKKRNG
jgi:hypothetical protein